MEFWSAGELANRRLVVRGDIKQWNQMLAETAHKAGVITTSSFPVHYSVGREVQTAIEKIGT